MKGDYEWYMKNDLREYAGKWVAICNKKVVESDKNSSGLLQKLEKKGLLNKVFMTKIPEGRYKYRI